MEFPNPADYSKTLRLIEKNHKKLRHNLLMPAGIRSNSIIDWVGQFTLESIRTKFQQERETLVSQGLPEFFFDLFYDGIELARGKVERFTNMAVFLQGDFSAYGELFKRTDMFDHFHTPRNRGEKCYSMTLFFPLETSEPSEQFYYFDLERIGYETLPYQTPEILVKDYNELSGRIQEWEKIQIPTKEILELRFCSSRLFHSVRHFKNKYLVFILNDARLIDAIDESKILQTRHALTQTL